MPKKRRLLTGAGLLLCVFAFTLPLSAGPVEQPESPFLVDGWSTKQGLPGSVVISLIQTRDGYLWLGTQYGLVRFDGVHFTVFDEGKIPGLNNDQIDYLFQDSHTNLWIGTDAGGVALEENGRIKNFALGRSSHEGRLVSACEDSTGTVWLYTADAHLGRYQNGKMEVWDFHFKTPALSRMMVVEKSDLLWIGEDWLDQERNVSLLFSFHPANVSPPAFAIEQQIPVQRLDYILARQRGGTWRLMDGQIQKWGSNQIEKNYGTYPWGNLPVFAACEDPAGNLIVGTRGAGVFWFEPDGKYRQISTAQGLSSPYVLSLCLDHAGNLWVGTDGGGLDRVKRKIFNTPDGAHPWDAQSLAGDATGGLWAAFNAHGVTWWQTNVAQDFGVGRGSNAWTVLVDHQQRVWVGTLYEGLFQFETNRFQPSPDTEILYPKISVLFEDQAGQLWAGTPNGLGLWNGQVWKTWTRREGLSGNVISAMAEDAAGNLWVGTKDGGLNRFQGGRFVAYPASDNGPSGNDISCLDLDKAGDLWVGTSGHGLARYHQGQWTHYSKWDGLVSDSISYLIEDDAGDLWIGSNLGIDANSARTLECSDPRSSGFVRLPDLQRS